MLGQLFQMSVSPQMLFAQLTLGLVNGAFYALLSLGMAVIFGLLNVVNFAHGAFYMTGAFAAWMLLHYFGVSFWAALLLGPLIVGLIGIVVERLLLSHLYELDHLYGMLVTFGLTLVIQSGFTIAYGSSAQPYEAPDLLDGGLSLGFMTIPLYRVCVVVVTIVVCVITWLGIEKTRLGAYLRAATENPMLVRAFGVRVPVIVTLTYGLGVGLAGLSGVLAAPIMQVSPDMGSNLIVVVFAIIVIGGMGSIPGAIISGFLLGLVEGMTKVFFPAASSTVLFILMAIILVVRPGGLFGTPPSLVDSTPKLASVATRDIEVSRGLLLLLIAVMVALPLVFYPALLMEALCLALFACAFNLLMGYAGLVSFGHAAFFGAGTYICAYFMKHIYPDPVLGLLAGTLGGTMLGALFGYFAIRRQGIYFSMVTLALAQMVYFYATRASWTGAEDGIQSVPRGRLFGIVDLHSDYVMYFFVLVVVSMGFFAMNRVIRSPFGLVLKGIRDNTPKAVSLGYRVERYKWLAFILSSALAALAGSLKTLALQIATLADLDWQRSGEVILVTLTGGVGTLFGPAAGSVFVSALQHLLWSFGAWVPLFQGAAFIAAVMAFRSGIVGQLLKLRVERGVRHPTTGAARKSPSEPGVHT